MTGKEIKVVREIGEALLHIGKNNITAAKQLKYAHKLLLEAIKETVTAVEGETDNASNQ